MELKIPTAKCAYSVSLSDPDGGSEGNSPFPIAPQSPFSRQTANGNIIRHSPRSPKTRSIQRKGNIHTDTSRKASTPRIHKRFDPPTINLSNIAVLDLLHLETVTRRLSRESVSYVW